MHVVMYCIMRYSSFLNKNIKLHIAQNITKLCNSVVYQTHMSFYTDLSHLKYIVDLAKNVSKNPLPFKK